MNIEIPIGLLSTDQQLALAAALRASAIETGLAAWGGDIKRGLAAACKIEAYALENNPDRD